MSEPKQHQIKLNVFAEIDRELKSKFICIDEKGNIKRGTLDDLVEYINLAKAVCAANSFDVVVIKINLECSRDITMHITSTGSLSFFKRPLTDSETIYLNRGLTKSFSETQAG